MHYAVFWVQGLKGVGPVAGRVGGNWWDYKIVKLRMETTVIMEPLVNTGCDYQWIRFITSVNWFTGLLEYWMNT